MIPPFSHKSTAKEETFLKLISQAETLREASHFRLEGEGVLKRVGGVGGVGQEDSWEMRDAFPNLSAG